MPNPLTTYTGNAGLGQGGGNVPVIGDTNNKVIDDTTRDIMLLSNQRNMAIWQQKIKDRDQLTNLVLQNQVPEGEIEPQYQKYYDAQADKVKEAFGQWKGNFNDTKGFQKYQGEVSELQRVAAHALTNSVQLKKLKQEEAAAETLPSKKKAIGDWIEKQGKQDFWEPVDPYQQFHDMNMDTFKGFVDPVKTETRDPNNPAIAYDQTQIDFDDILRKSRGAYINDLDKANDIQQLYDKFSKYDQPQLKKTLDAMDGQIDKYNQQRGFKEGDKGYVPHVNRVTGPDGNVAIKEPSTDFAAKYALSNQEQFVTKTPKFDFKMMAAIQKNKDLSIKERDLGRKWFDANTKRMAVQLKARQLDKADDATKQFSQVWDSIAPNINLPNIAPGTSDWAAGQEGFQIDAGKLPEGYQYVQGIDGKGQPIRLIPIGAEEVTDPKTKKVIGYQGGHYNTSFFVPAGTKIKGTTIKKDIQLNAKELYDLYERSGYKGDFKDFINEKFNNKEIDYQLEGKNGRANRVSAFISQMAVGNKMTKKGQESPYSQDELDLIGSQNTETEPETAPSE